MTQPKIVFLGTPEFAVPSLQALIDQKFDIRLVVTQPDRKSGRGQKLTAPPVKVLAQSHGIQVLQPQSLKKGPELETLLSLDFDFLIVVAFGQILPKALLDHPKIAPLNVHASILPAYRGAAPIARSIIEGDTKTGVTIQWMIEALDQGDILYQKFCLIHEETTAKTLHDELKILGAEALIETLQIFSTDRLVRLSQDARVGTHAAKLQKEEAHISFDQDGFFVHRAIMGMNPFPIAECLAAGERLRIHRSRFVPRSHSAEPGTILEISKDEILVACRNGCIAFLDVQAENKRVMPVSEYLKSHHLPIGLCLGRGSHG